MDWHLFITAFFYHEEREGHEEKHLQELQDLHGDNYQNLAPFGRTLQHKTEISILSQQSKQHHPDYMHLRNIDLFGFHLLRFLPVVSKI